MMKQTHGGGKLELQIVEVVENSTLIYRHPCDRYPKRGRCEGLDVTEISNLQRISVSLNNDTEGIEK
jgi:hypothetical protein